MILTQFLVCARQVQCATVLKGYIPNLQEVMLHTLGQNVALILHDVLGAKVPLSGTIENGSNTCHWKFVTSSLTNKE